jgi:hypothetical protein
MIEVGDINSNLVYITLILFLIGIRRTSFGVEILLHLISFKNLSDINESYLNHFCDRKNLLRNTDFNLLQNLKSFLTSIINSIFIQSAIQSIPHVLTILFFQLFHFLFSNVQYMFQHHQNKMSKEFYNFY